MGLRFAFICPTFLVSPLGAQSEWDIHRDHFTFGAPDPAYDAMTNSAFTISYTWSRAGSGPLHLVRWQNDELHHWPLRREDGEPLIVENAIHAVLATRHYIILVESDPALPSGGIVQSMAQFGNPLVGDEETRKTTALHWIARSQFEADIAEAPAYLRTTSSRFEGSFWGHAAATFDDQASLVSFFVYEIADHFLLNYNPPGGVHAIDGKPLAPAYATWPTMNYEPSHLVRYDLNPLSGEICGRHQMSTPFWFPFEVSVNSPLGGFCGDAGFWHEVFPIKPGRGPVPNTVPPTGHPSGFYRFDPNTLELRDQFLFPAGVFCTGGLTLIDGVGTQNKYLVYLVHLKPESPASSGNEFWIFDAAALGAGPCCRLGHPDYFPGMPLNTLALDRLAPRESHYKVGLAEELREAFRSYDAEVRDVLERDVVSHFE